MILVAVSRDVEDRVAGREHAPQSTLGAFQPPASLVHVHGLARAHAAQQLLVRVLERARRARQDRVDRTGADACTEQLFDQLHDIAAADAVACREHSHGSFKARPERAACDLSGKLRSRALATARAAHALGAMLDHDRRDDRQLFDLMALRIADGDEILRRELMPTATAPGPALDDLLDRARRQQLTAVALMARLRALRTPREVLAASRTALARRARTRRLRRATRTAPKLTFQRRDPLILARNPRAQLLDPRRQPLVLLRDSQQHRHHRVTTLPINRLRLNPLHNPQFRRQAMSTYPPTERLRFS